jgi:hypothetical protein
MYLSLLVIEYMSSQIAPFPLAGKMVRDRIPRRTAHPTHTPSTCPGRRPLVDPFASGFGLRCLLLSALSCDVSKGQNRNTSQT